MVQFSHYLIVFAGESLNGEENDLWAFNLNTSQWEEIKAKGPDVEGRKGHSCLLYAQDFFTYLLVFGGITKGRYLDEMLVLRVSLGKSSLVASWALNEFRVEGSSPGPREGSSFFMFNEQPMIMNGCNYKESACFDDLFGVNLGKSSILFETFNVLLEPQERALVVNEPHGFWVFPGHSKSNKLVKKSFFVLCESTCSGNGRFEANHCICDPNYFGQSCETLCKNGVYANEICLCDPGYAAPSCEFLQIPSLLESPCVQNCHNRGSCSNSQCHCLSEYFGLNCEFKYCDSSCGSENNRGLCDHNTGLCQCQDKYGGKKCEFFCPFGCPEGLGCVKDYHCACEGCPISSFNCNERGTAIEGVCHCIKGYCGKFCEDKCEDCNGHGEFNGACCECFNGYYGRQCELECLELCSNNGKCELGKCNCFNNWSGPTCSTKNVCESCVHGKCIQNECVCYKGYAGPSCSTIICPMNCTILSTHYEVLSEPTQIYNSLESIPLNNSNKVIEVQATAGFCNMQKFQCECFQNFYGSDCSQTSSCPDCLNGQCRSGQCVCDPGFKGVNCDVSVCPQACSHNGECVQGKCQCWPVWSSEDCSTCLCKQGKCVRSVCECSPGWEGKYCEVYVCDKCLHGICVSNSCICSQGYSGKYCDSCEDPIGCYSCNSDIECNHGNCIGNTCLCDSRYTGKHCDVLICAGHGVFKHESCVCDPGFSGKNCSVSLNCPLNCSNHGVCHTGKCFCEPEFTGEDCSLSKSCPENCNYNGQCKLGRCFCFPGFQGPTCLPSRPSCQDCSGACIAGKCFCNDSPQSLIETSQNCPLSCSNHGKCIEGSCVCVQNWEGEACELHVFIDNSGNCIKDNLECSGNGICNNGICYCKTGFSGVLCEVLGGCQNCSGKNQVCVNGRCECVKGRTGDGCEEMDLCLIRDCGEFGVCVRGICYCQYGYGSDGEGPCELELVKLAGVAVFVSVVYAGVIVVFLFINGKG